jgi:para-nitrobenzyl esterase
MVDGKILPDQMVTALDRGIQSAVPILAGFNQGEIRSLTILAPKAPASAADYAKEIRARYGNLADAFLKLYPAADYRESILATTRDALYGWTAERLVRKQAAQGRRSYLYLFDHGYPAMDAAGLHAFHASELPYVFGTTDRSGPNWPKIPATADEHALSEAMLDYWASFAARGKPTYPSVHGLQRAAALARAHRDAAIAALGNLATRAPDLVALADLVVERDR